jgi:hypothetical protein
MLWSASVVAVRTRIQFRPERAGAGRPGSAGFDQQRRNANERAANPFVGAVSTPSCCDASPIRSVGKQWRRSRVPLLTPDRLAARRPDRSKVGQLRPPRPQPKEATRRQSPPGRSGDDPRQAGRRWPTTTSNRIGPSATWRKPGRKRRTAATPRHGLRRSTWATPVIVLTARPEPISHRQDPTAFRMIHFEKRHICVRRRPPACSSGG